MATPRTLVLAIGLALAACGNPSTGAPAAPAGPTLARPAPPVAEPIELVLVGGKVFTADPARPWAEAIAVRGARVAAVGTTAEIRGLPGVTSATRVVELAGRVVIPGLNDAHSHVPGMWSPHRAKIATRSPTLDDTVAAVRAATKTQPPGTWIVVPIGDAAYDDPKASRALLDPVSPDHPVMTSDNAGHAKLLNTAGMKALGISDVEPDPPHGRYGRDPRTKRLNGWMFEYATFAAITKLEEAHDDAAIAQATDELEATALGYGITSVQTMPAIATDRFVRVQATRTPRLRWRVIRWPRGTIATQFERGSDDGRVRVSGVKYILDGTPIERWAYRSQPYADRPKHRGHSNFTAAELQQIVEVADRTGEQLLLHAVGDAALDALIGAMERQGTPERWRTRRVRIEHGDMLTPSQIQRAAALGMILVQNPVHFLIPDVMTKRLGTCGGICQPLASAQRANLAVALGSDGPLNPFLGIMAASVHPTTPGEAMTREQAVSAYTRGAAFAEGKELEKGTLAPGMLADLAVLTEDIFTAPPDRLPAARAWMTVVDGKVVHETPADRTNAPK